MIEALIPMVCSVSMFAMIFGIVYLRSRENMAMIDRGLNPRAIKTGPRPFTYLKYGLLMIGAGVGLLIAYFVDLNTMQKVVMPSGIVLSRHNPAAYFSLIGIGGGLGLVLSFLVEKKYWIDKKELM